MSILQKEKINEIRSYLLLHEDKTIKQIINSSHTRINGITSKEFMNKNKMEYEISINSDIIYNCNNLPKKEKIECNIFGNYSNIFKTELKISKKIKENKIDLALQKHFDFEKFNKKACIIRKLNQKKLDKENNHFLKRFSYYLKNPIKEKLKYIKSINNFPIKNKDHFKINLHSNSYFPSKKKSTKNLKKYLEHIKCDKDMLKNIYNFII